MDNGEAFPFYLVFDLSASVDMLLDQLNASVRSIVEHVQADPIAGDFIHLSIISFSEGAEVRVPLTRNQGSVDLPSLLALGSTHYGPMLALLAATINADAKILKRSDLTVYRPVVMILTADSPTDHGWETQLEGLKGTPAGPTIFTFGIGDVDPAPLAKLASPGKAFLATSGTAPEVGLSAFTDFVIQVMSSIKETTQSDEQEARFAAPKSFTPVPFTFD